MQEMIRSIERSALQYSPELVVPAGVLILVAGLWIWLGGLQLSRWIAGLAGAMAGALLGLLFASQVAAVFILSILGAAAGAFFSRCVLVCNAVLLATVVIVVLFAGSGTQAAADTALPKSPDPGRQTLSAGQTADFLLAQARALGGFTAEAVRNLPAVGYAAGVVMLVVAALAGVFLPRLTAASGCAALGTGMIFVGMVLLLLYKGAQPLSAIYTRSSFYAMSAIGMVCFGAMIELLLSPRSGKRMAGSRRNGEKG